MRDLLSGLSEPQCELSAQLVDAQLLSLCLLIERKLNVFVADTLHASVAFGSCNFSAPCSQSALQNDAQQFEKHTDSKTGKHLQDCTPATC
jgi:hypothetical protein